MSTVEHVEYHTHCPSCGAGGDGSEHCPYCGTSMVKTREVTHLAEDAEDVILREDAGLPLEKVKNGQVSTFLKAFCGLFGGIWIAVSVCVGGAFTAAGIMRPWLACMLAMFAAIGVCALIPLIAASAGKRKAMNGNRVTGVVRGYDNANTSINNTPTKTIRIRLDSQPTRLIEFNTGETKRRYPIGTKLSLLTDGQRYLIEGPAA